MADGTGGARQPELPPYLLQDSASLELFVRQSLLDGLNGNKFKTTSTQSSDERKQQYLDGLGIDTGSFDALHNALQQLDVAFRGAFIRFLRSEREKKLQQLNLLSFDALIGRLAEALRGERAAWLQQSLRERFKAALIDEFQDTDQQQWHIFSTLFAKGEAYLYLIGDPKQAIYKFRGADIYSYFEAQRQAHRHFTLGKNWRSQPLLVEAVNAVFGHHPRPFWFEELHFVDVRPAVREARPEMLPPLMLWQVAASDTKDGYWSAGKARQIIQAAAVDEVLRLCGHRIDAVAANDNNGHGISGTERVSVRDIAILVRTNQAAREYQHALQAAGVPAVLNSVESVFATREAHDLYLLLQALAHPGDSLLLKQALSLQWFGLDGQALYHLSNDEAALDAWMLRVQEYHRQWQSAGLMAMMLEFVRAENIYVQLAQYAGAERSIANIQHLLELLQQACIDEHLGILKALDWLLAAIIEAERNAGEEQLVRLDSDAEAVQIVTLHRSKGLEYPVVFCPDLWARSDRLSREADLVECHEDGRRIADLGSARFEARRAKALQEELAEDLRVIYVALTRAKYRCYVAWADVRTRELANGSALAYLLFSEGGENWRETLKHVDFAQQQQRLQGFGGEAAGFGYRLLDAEMTLLAEAGSLSSAVSLAPLAALPRKRHLYTDWQMSSYTALSALSLREAAELPEDKAQETFVIANAETVAGDISVPESGLPRGAHTGNVIHELLETQSFRSLAAGKDLGVARDQACLRYGLKLERPLLVEELLQLVVQTPLDLNDGGFMLANLDERLCLKEMPFYLSLPQLATDRINEILGACPAFHPLQPKQLQGFLTGFIDLVCCYEGRYYLIDYKTNALDSYDAPRLLHAMREHNYGLQYWIYTLVLHRYLQGRLSGYDYLKHFGGVRYLFVRGMNLQRPMHGIFADFPDIARLQALQELFS